LFSQKFKQAVTKALESQKLVLAVVHLKAKDPLITQAKQRQDAEIFTVMLTNKDKLAEQITKKAQDIL